MKDARQMFADWEAGKEPESKQEEMWRAEMQKFNKKQNGGY